MHRIREVMQKMILIFVCLSVLPPQPIWILFMFFFFVFSFVPLKMKLKWMQALHSSKLLANEWIRKLKSQHIHSNPAMTQVFHALLNDYKEKTKLNKMKLNEEQQQQQQQTFSLYWCCTRENFIRKFCVNDGISLKWYICNHILASVWHFNSLLDTFMYTQSINDAWCCHTNFLRNKF